MFEYMLRLLVLIPLIGGMAYGSLWLSRRVQRGLPAIPGFNLGPKTTSELKIVDVLSMGQGGKIALVSFGDKQLLIGVSKAQMTLLSEREMGDFHAD